jgi:iron complex transport system substrate-binding protein
MRIVSLLPSATETLAAIGAGEDLVGITHACDWPPELMHLPRVTTTAVPAALSSGEVDRLVQTRYAAGQPLYQLDRELLAALRPDLLVTQGLCDVCAVADADARSVAHGLPGPPEVVSLAPTTLADVFENIRELGDLTGRTRSALDVVAGLRRRVEAVASRVTGLARPRVSLIEWIDPPYACGHWTPELVSLGGGVEGHGRAGARSRRIAPDELVRWQPEVLVLACCGLDAAAAARDLPSLAAKPGFLDLPAVRTGRVYAVDGNACFSRPGPRLVESLELLAWLLHPETFPAAAGRAVRVSPAGEVLPLLA